LTNCQTVHGQCGGFLDMIFKDKSLKLKKLKVLMLIVKNRIKEIDYIFIESILTIEKVIYNLNID